MRGAQCRELRRTASFPRCHVRDARRPRRAEAERRTTRAPLRRLLRPHHHLTPPSCSHSMSDISSQLHGGYAHDLTRAWSAQSSSLTKSMFMLPRACSSRRPPSLFLYRH